MNRKILFFIVFVFQNAMAQNSQNVPSQYKSEKIIMEKKTSIISIPVEISIQDIQNQVNDGLPMVIYEDNSFDDDNKDDLKVKVTRKGNLVFTAIQNDVFFYEVPLKVWAQKRISAFGMSQSPETNFELKMKFSTKFGINTNYTFNPVTNALGFDWISKPVLKTGLIDIPIAPIIGKLIENKQGTFAKQIDVAIAEKLDLKPAVMEAWNKAKTPFKVSDEYNTWIKIEPIESYIVPITATNNGLKTTIGLKVIAETIVGNPDLNITKTTVLPNLLLVKNIPQNFELSLFNIISYQEANNISKKMFVGQKYSFKDGRYNIYIEDMEIYGNNENLVLKLISSGSFNGSIFVKGIPKYEPSLKKVILTKTSIDIKTKNFLHKTASWLLSGYLEKKIEKEFGLPLDEVLGYAKENALKVLNSEISKGIKLKGNITSMDPEEIKVDERGILAMININANVQIMVNGLK